MKKLSSFILFLSILLSIFPIGNNLVYAEEFKLNAKGAILIDAESGQVLFEQNAHEPWYPASVTKIMTMALALEAVDKGKVSLNDIIRPSENACSYGGSQVWLDPRDEFTLEEMLIAIAVGSANDASVAVAEFISGTEENFVKMMNNKAKEIGATNTNFVNSHGLHDDNHYTTPADMAKIARYALSYPKLLELTSIKHYKFRDEPKELILHNTNKLLWRYPGTDGLKTGTTSKALRNLVSTVQKDNLRLIGVVMGVEQTGGHFSESIKLYNWGFALFKYEQLFSEGQIVTTTKVSKGKTQEVPLVAAKKIGTIVKKDNGEIKIEPIIKVPSYIPAPIKKGDKVGLVEILANGKLVNTIDLLAGDSVEKASFLNIFDRTFRNIFCY
ncbi:MAG: D-alanyl-D-alanine carboxypeptidase family protein [Zhaonellaceae bacterium]|jgi:D-alanyl-D-alanine carboxypeptidase (penicillin-binding protein 5/6)|nr:D-alanyl-D-alanine carboxypeptidase [Clostridia bacterium]